MLIRICDHFKDNPKRIDKLIAIKGLPREWLFRESPEGTELRKPWECDVDVNIPIDIRHLCEPMYILSRYAALNAGAKEFIEKRKVLGVRIDYNTEPGRQMWDDVERFVDGTIPRNERIPVAVLCAKDERSGFDTYTPRRNSRGSLELVPGPIPLVDLTKYIEVKSVLPEIPNAADVLKTVELEHSVEQHLEGSELKCEQCDYHHSSHQGIRMHTMKKHPKKEKVGV